MEGVVVDDGCFPTFGVTTVPKIIAIKVRSGRKSTEILHVFGPPIFFGGGEPPEFLDSIYLIQPVSDHVAKFQGDPSRELGENLAK